MKKILKWLGIVLGGLLGVILVAAIALSIAGSERLNKTHEVQARNVTIPTDDEALARGEHLVNATCKSCHGPDLSGQPMIDDPMIGAIYAANITGLADTHTDTGLMQAIRHGLGTDGRQLIIMPAESFIYFSERDLGSIFAYLKSVPRAGDPLPKPELALVGRILLGAGIFGNMFPAEYIDHDLPFPEMPEMGVNEAHGEYLARLCMACHGLDLLGSQLGDPDSPPAPNLTPSGELGQWTEQDFIAAMRIGVTPSGRQLDPAFMPWESIGKLADDELRSLWLYLESLSPSMVVTD